MVCKTCSAQQCLAMAATRCRKPSGDGTVMWSPRYNRWWGCRCCRPPNGRRLHRNNNWELWAGGDYTPPPPPPPTHSPTGWPTQAGHKAPYLVMNARSCYRQITMLCKTCKAAQCVRMAMANSRCQRGDGSVMWSPRYNRWWGCRCCQKSPSISDLRRNGNWQLWAGGHYKKPVSASPLSRAGGSGSPRRLRRKRSCKSEAAYLGRGFKTPQQCARMVKSGPGYLTRRCRSKTFMWSPRFYRWWGCRCCRTTGTRGNRHWDVWSA